VWSPGEWWADTLTPTLFLNGEEESEDVLNIVALIQARMTSTRLPGKVMQDIGGEPMIWRVVERVRRARMLTNTVVITSVDPSDDPLAQFCEERGVPVFRGSLQDVLDRYMQAVRTFAADVVVRITADCPVIDPGEIDHTVNEFLRSGVDFAANRLPPPLGRTYPIGLDTEVCSAAALERAWREADQKYQREHVMPYLYEVPGRFKVLRVDHDPDYGALRWTVDTPADLEFIRQVYARFNGRTDFTWLEMLDLMQREPELAQINAGVGQKLYNKHG
jgi:spore coat polysaccharide biosynthesis protein SpsF